MIYFLLCISHTCTKRPLGDDILINCVTCDTEMPITKRSDVTNKERGGVSDGRDASIISGLKVETALMIS